MNWRSVSNLYQRIEQHRYVFDAPVPSILLYASFIIVWINDNVMVYEAGILALNLFFLIIDSTETSAFVSLYFSVPFPILFSYFCCSQHALRATTLSCRYNIVHVLSYFIRKLAAEYIGGSASTVKCYISHLLFGFVFVNRTHFVED